MRLFVAISLPETVRERLADLGGGVPGARWVRPENMHLTLKFVGDIDHGLADDLDMNLGRIDQAAFAITLTGVDRFADGRNTRAIWVGVERCDPLLRLRQSVDASVRATGVLGDDRKFTPHVTLARCKNAPVGRVGQFLTAANPFRSEPIQVRTFDLFSSHLASDGPIYTLEASYPLRA